MFIICNNVWRCKTKKCSLIIIVIFLTFFAFSKANAEQYTCAYSANGYTFTVDFDSESKTMFAGNICKGILCRPGSLGMVDELVINSDETLLESKADLMEEINENIYSGSCDTTLLVFKYYSNGAGHDYLRILFNENLEAYAKEYMDGNITSGTYQGLTNEWAKFDQSKSTASGKSIGYSCLYDSLYENLEENAKLLKNCKQDCASIKSVYDKQKQKIKSFCHIQFEHLDYNHSCVQSCVQYNEKVKKLEKDNNINSNKSSQCSLSGRLISWIANIVKWLKYIVPVIVIIFGILDFIKAMSVDKDDEMKKAQSKFIKRLIAAALIFLIPLIIGFVLDQFGFDEYIKGCGIVKELD